MEELIPFIFFVVWLLFSGVGSKKKREDARRRAEIEAADRRARAEQQRAMRESREADGRVTFPEAQTEESSDTSLDMIPDELWDILTGGAPRPTRPGQQPTTSREPVPSGGWVTSPPWDEDDAVHSIEGVSHEDESTEVVDYDDDASRTARARYEDLDATSADERADRREAIAARADETADSRHVEFHDRLSATEIGAVAVAAPLTSAGALRLGLRNPGDVRRAIVLAEILGPPKSLR